MMMSLKRRLIAVPAAALAFAVSSCHDANSVMQSVGQPVPRSITPRTTATTAGPTAVVTLVLDVRGDVGKIGSYTGRLRYDAVALIYDGESEISDGTLRATNPGIGEIRVAGASAAGVDLARLAAFRFIVKDPAALQFVQFDLEEVHELSHVNLQPNVVRSASRPLK